MYKMTFSLLALAVSLIVVTPAFADVHLTMHDGRVSLVAKDATLRQILAEWARVGQTRIVNAEQVPGGPLTLELTDMPEKQALDILLRSISGYLAAPRPTFIPDASRFDRILVLPTSAPPRAAATSSAPAPLPQPRFQLPVIAEPDDTLSGLPADPAQRSPVINQFTPPFPGAPPPTNGRQAAPPTFAAPTAPIGTAAPGMVIQPPPQPVQPGQPARF